MPELVPFSALQHADVPLVSVHSIFLQKDEGKIVLAGALADPVDSALFIWKDASREVYIGLSWLI